MLGNFGLEIKVNIWAVASRDAWLQRLWEALEENQGCAPQSCFERAPACMQSQASLRLLCSLKFSIFLAPDLMEGI